MKLSEVIYNNIKEAIITDFDVPGFPQPTIDKSYDYNNYGFMVLASTNKSSKGNGYICIQHNLMHFIEIQKQEL